MKISYAYQNISCIVVVVKHKTQSLEARFATSVLIVLLKGPMIKGNLTAYLSSGSKAVADRVADLQELGLVTEEQESQRPFRKIVQLTDKGRQVAEKLAEIEEILYKG